MKKNRIARISLRIAEIETEGWWMDPEGRVYSLKEYDDFHHTFTKEHPGVSFLKGRWIKIRYLEENHSLIFDSPDSTVSTLKRIQKFVSNFSEPLEIVYIFVKNKDFVAAPEKLLWADKFKDIVPEY